MRLQALLACLLVLVAGCSSTTTSDETTGSALETPTTPAWDGSHVHDHYGPQTELLLMDKTMALTVAHNHMFDEPPRDQHTHGCDETLTSSSQGGTIKFSLPAGTIVPPGTASLQVEADWSAPTITGIRLLYRPPTHDHGPSPHNHDADTGYMDAGPLQAGEAVTIEVGPTTTDVGHAFHSSWAFFLCAAGGSSVELAQGDVHLQVVSVRADEIPLDPPHPDHWNGTTHLRLGQMDWKGQAMSAANQGDTWFQVPLDEGAIVPLGTRHVTITVNTTATGATASSGHEIWAYYRDASSVEWDYRRLTGTGPAEARTFTIDIEQGEADDLDALDSPYASRSHWDFWVRVSATAGSSVPGAGYWTAPLVFEGTVQATVTAWSTAVD